MPAIEVLTQALESAEGTSRVECFFLRGVVLPYQQPFCRRRAPNDKPKLKQVPNDG